MDIEKEGGVLEGKEEDGAAMWEGRWGGNCRRKRRKQLINQHRKETEVQTAEQRWRCTHTDRWGQGGRASSSSLCTAGCGWQNAPLSSPLSLWTSYLHVWMSEPWQGILVVLGHELKHPLCGQTTTQSPPLSLLSPIPSYPAI